MIVEDLNEFVNEDSVKGELTRELLDILADFKNGRIDIDAKNELVKSVEEGFKAENAHADEQTAKFLRKAVETLLSVV